MQENTKYWLALNKIENLGPITIKKLWEYFGSVEKIWQASNDEISQIEGLNKKAVKSFLENRSNIDLDEEINNISEQKISALTLDDEEYPDLLKHIYDPPPVLYVKGMALDPKEKTLAIVGTRKASRYGKEIAGV
jgi:DNA processing protein